MFIAHPSSFDDDDDDGGTVVTIATWDGRSVATATTSRTDGSSGTTNTHYHTIGTGRPCKRRRRQKNATAVLSMLSLLSAALILATTSSSSSFSLRGTKPSMFRLQSMGGRFTRKLLDLKPEHIDEYPFNGLADVFQPFGGRKGITDTGLYWQIPRSGGTTLKTILGTCLNRVQASRVARDHCDLTDDNLHLCQTTFGRYVNADPSDDPGIERSHQLDLVGSGLADVLVSSRILHVSELFDEEHHHGRAFTVLRHPVERTASTFYYLQNAEWERQYSPELKTMSLADYAQLESTANDWMVRWLTGKHAEVLTRSDLEFAKELLRRKFLILLTDEMKTSVTRLASYMGWSINDDMMGCIDQHSTRTGGANKSGAADRPPLEPGMDDYEALLNINRLDVELYEYAQELFVAQWSTIQDRAKEHGMDLPPPPSSLASSPTDDINTKSTTTAKKGLFGFLQRNGKNEHPQDQQDEIANNESTAKAIETTNTATPLVQHGIIATDEVLLEASVGSATPGSTVAEAARFLGKEVQAPPTPQAAGSNGVSDQEQPSAYAKDQHGVVERQTQADAADTTIVSKGHRVVQTQVLGSRQTPENYTSDKTIVNKGHNIVHTQEMNMSNEMNEMKRKALVVLQEHKRRLGAGGNPSVR